MSIVSSILSLFSSSSSSSSSSLLGMLQPNKYGGSTAGKYLQSQRRIVKQLIETPFQQGWQFRIEIDGAPTDFDMYVRDVTYGQLTVEYETKQIGSISINSPINRTITEISLTVRDHEDGRLMKYFDSMADKVTNADGTVNLSSKYLTKMRMYRILSSDKEVLESEWRVSIGGYEVSRSRAELNQFVSYPVTFECHRS